MQDLRISAKSVMHLWQSRKISHTAAIRDLLACRDPAAHRLWQFVGAVRDGEEAEAGRQGMSEVVARAPSLLGAFREHLMIDRWLALFRPEAIEQSLRFKSLLLRGASRSGKSCKAQSIFGIERTLCVNCQGLGTALPSIRAFNRQAHDAILWDEISPAQVLANKLVFQSGPMTVTLSQSACNGFAYEKWLFGTPHVLCSNDFQMENRSGLRQMPAEDLDWLQANIIEAALEPGEVWFLRRSQQLRPVAVVRGHHPGRRLLAQRRPCG